MPLVLPDLTPIDTDEECDHRYSDRDGCPCGAEFEEPEATDG